MDEVDLNQQREINRLNAESIRNKATDALQWVALLVALVLGVALNVWFALANFASHTIEIKLIPNKNVEALLK